MPAHSRDYYSELGLQPDATQDEIRTAFRSLAKRYHPDLHHGDTKAKERFQRIADAYRTLSDPQQRMKYHAGHGIGLRVKAARETAKFRGVDPESESFNVLLQRAFQSGFGILGKESGGKPRPQRGEDFQTSLELDLLQLSSGGAFPLTLSRKILCTSCGGAGVRPVREKGECSRCLGLGEIPSSKQGKTVFVVCPQCEGAGFSTFERCSVCDGAGRVTKRVAVQVVVPPHSRADKQIRAAGEGHSGAFGGENGDLIVRLKEKAVPGFERDGQDLKLNLEINLLQALGGEEIELETPDGTRRITLKSPAWSNRPLRIKGAGLSKANGEKGDLVMHLRIRIPEKLDERSIQLLKELMQSPQWKIQPGKRVKPL